MTFGSLAANPYDWPYDGVIDPTRTALVLIDWQVDFCGPGGYVDRMGYDLNLTRAAARRRPPGCWRRCASAGFTIIHTREGHRPDLSDLPANKLLALARRSAPGSATPARPAGSWSRASPAGRSCPRWPRSRASRSSTSRARARSTPPTST